jgi:hypothetical protein
MDDRNSQLKVFVVENGRILDFENDQKIEKYPSDVC